MSLLRQEPQDITSEESQDGEDDLQSLTWREIVENHNRIFESVLERIITFKPTKAGDKNPDQLIEVATTIWKIVSSMNSLDSHEDDFEQLRVDASGLVVVLWQIYNKARQLWPPPKYKTSIKEFVETVRDVHELMKRKCEDNLAKRALVGYLGMRNLGKFKKYRRKLGSMASFLESAPNNIDISEVLREVVNSQAQPQDSNPELSAEATNSPTKNGTKKRADTRDNRAGGSRQREAEMPAVAKPIKQEVESEESIEDDRREASTSRKKKGKKKDHSTDISAEERSEEDKKPPKEKADNGRPAEEGDAGPEVKKSGGTKKAKRPPKMDDEDLESDDKGNGTSQLQDDDEDSEPAAKTVPRKKGPARPKVKSQTMPPPGLSSISNFSFTNSGSGSISNNNVGNITNSIITDVGNDYSKNYAQARRKRTHG